MRLDSSPLSKLPTPAALAVAAIAWIFMQPAFAQTVRSGGNAQNSQLVQQLQQLASERTAWQAEQARMKGELEDLRKERDALKAGQAADGQRSRASSDAAIARSNRERDALEAELNKTRLNTQELITKFRETGRTLRDVETERTTLKQVLAARGKELGTCAASNDALYHLNDEVLTFFGDESLWKRMTEAEPFTKLRRVQLDNLIEQYRYRADDQKVSLAPDSTPPLPAPGVR